MYSGTRYNTVARIVNQHEKDKERQAKQAQQQTTAHKVAAPQKAPTTEAMQSKGGFFDTLKHVFSFGCSVPTHTRG